MLALLQENYSNLFVLNCTKFKSSGISDEELSIQNYQEQSNSEELYNYIKKLHLI